MTTTTRSTAGQRAKWAIERAIAAGKLPEEETLKRQIELMSKEEIQLDQEMSELLRMLQQSNPVQEVHQSSYNGLHNNLSQQMNQETTTYNIPWHVKESAQDLKDGGSENKYAERLPKGKKEKDWYDFFSNRFGPLIVLILWASTANLEKATFYAPTPSEIQPVSLPLAKVATKIENWFHVPTWVHDVATSSDDIVSIGMAVTAYLDRIGALEKMVPFYRNLSSRMSVKKNDRTREETKHTRSTSALQPAVFAGIGSQHLSDI